MSVGSRTLRRVRIWKNVKRSITGWQRKSAKKLMAKILPLESSLRQSLFSDSSQKPLISLKAI
jgi:hypothetical protein